MNCRYLLNLTSKPDLTGLDRLLHLMSTSYGILCPTGCEIFESNDHVYYDINSRNSHGETALMIASVENDLEMVDFLLTMDDIDVNMWDNADYHALITAVDMNHIEIVRSLVNSGKVDVNRGFSNENYGTNSIDNCSSSRI